MKKKKLNKGAEMESNMTDPQGSYTGKGIDEMERPIQDADDL